VDDNTAAGSLTAPGRLWKATSLEDARRGRQGIPAGDLERDPGLTIFPMDLEAVESVLFRARRGGKTFSFVHPFRAI